MMHVDEKIIERMIRLLLKEVREELTPEERTELDAYMQANFDNKEWHERIKSLVFIEENYRWYKGISGEGQAWKRLERDINRKVKHSVGRIWISSVAAVVAMVVCSILFLQEESSERPAMVSPKNVHELATISLVVDSGRDSMLLEINKDREIALAGVRNENNALIYDTLSRSSDVIEYHTLSVGRGGEYQLTLPDGTLVWLNSESSLRYPTRFSGDRREVELKGEGFFVVSRDESMPFMVKNDHFHVEVLGTSFNIMNYTDERYAQVTLATGKISVNQGDRHVIIDPNQQVLLGENTFEVRQVNSRYYTTWHESKFMFDDEPLDVIIRKLARWYNLDYAFKDSTLMNTRFSGQLLKYDDITEAFKLLEMTTDVHFAIHQKTIWIMKGK